MMKIKPRKLEYSDYYYHDGKILELSDLGNAHRFTFDHFKDVHFVPEWDRWLIWTGTHWETDKKGAVRCLMQDSIRQIKDEASRIDDRDFEDLDLAESMRKAVKNHGRNSQASHKINNALREASVLKLKNKEIPVTVDELDSDLMVLNCLDGTVDLRTGQLKPHDRKDLITRLAPVGFCTEGREPGKWLIFLDKVLCGDSDLISFIQRALGYTLTGLCSEECLFYLLGDGGSGKSTFLDFVMKILGSYGKVAAPNLLTQTGQTQHPTMIAELVGRRFVMTSEVDQDARFAENLAKQLTGEDKLNARFMRQDSFEFNATFKLWIAANYEPKIKGTDKGIWRRVKIIPFDAEIKNKISRIDLEQEVLEEAPQILAWMVRGCLDWQKHRLGEPDTVKRKTAKFRKEVDTIAAWLIDNCRTQKRGDNLVQTAFKALNEDYQEYCRKNGLEPLSQIRVSKELVKRGFKRFHDGSSRGFFGIEIVSVKWKPNMESVMN